VDAKDETNALPAPVLSGLLHAYVAFDWGEELDLEAARRLIPAEIQDLLRRRRTPTSFAYSPPPLRVPLPGLSISLDEVGTVQPEAEATLFDFGGVSVWLRIPLQLSPQQVRHLAGTLAEPRAVVEVAQSAVSPLFEKLKSAIVKPDWEPSFSEEYFVFHFPPEPALDPALLLRDHRPWLAGLLRLEQEPLSAEEIHEALERVLSYTPADVFLPDWASAVLVDRDCDETLQAIEFANLQLLEYRFMDHRLDGRMRTAYQLISYLSTHRLPFWRTHARPLRMLGELKAEANQWFERTGNVLKLVGDQYLARVHQQLAARFHLGEWEEIIRRKIAVLEGIYQIVSDQAGRYRGEVLEWVVVILIAFEIIMAFVRH
jgi:hypothetical protein